MSSGFVGIHDFLCTLALTWNDQQGERRKVCSKGQMHDVPSTSSSFVRLQARSLMFDHPSMQDWKRRRAVRPLKSPDISSTYL